MKSVVAGVVCAVGVAVLLGAGIGAQEQPAAAGAADPRVGLKPGLKNAGQAARNLELVSSLPKPPGFFDPKMPAGEPTEPEVEAKPDAKPDVKPEVSQKPDAKQAGTRQAPGAAARERPRTSRTRTSPSAASTSSSATSTASTSTTSPTRRKPKLLASIVCPGGQGDVSVHGNLLVMSVEQTRGRLDCGTQGVEPAVSTERFRGVRVFDITDVKKPKQVAAVQTCRGSHTHTLVANPSDKANLYVYGSGTGTVRAARRALRLFGRRAQGRSEHGALQHRRHPDPDRRAREGPHRQPSAHLRRRVDAARSPACGRVATTGPARRRPR